MNILVVGLGALGTVYSCLLKGKGHRVTALARSGAAEIIRERGVSVTGIWGSHGVKLDEVVSDTEALKERNFDLILLTVKSFDTAKTADQIKSLVSPGTYLVLLQNGHGNFEAAARYIPEENLILGRVIFGSETLDVGAAKVTVIADDVIIGSPVNLVGEALLERFSQAFNEAGIPTRVSDSVMKYVWGKIIYNSALNPLGAIFEVSYGELVENEYTKSIIDDVIREIFELLKLSGHETLWPDAQAYSNDFYTKMLPTTAAHHASMLQDILRGRKTEVDALNGAVVRLGEQYGLEMPVNRLITQMIKAKERFS